MKEEGDSAADQFAACAEIVSRADPERWRAAMAAPDASRPHLMALYAFNVEISRAPWATSEQMLARIRLKWWDEAVAEIYSGGPVRHHEVVDPLAGALGATGLPQSFFAEMIEARGFDADPAPFADIDALERHIDHTAAHLMVAAASILGARGAALDVVREYGRGTGLAAFLRALPEYERRGHAPLPPGTDAGELAADAHAAIAAARARRADVPESALPAMLAGVLAEARLSAWHRASGQSRNLEERVEAMELSEFAQRARLAWVALTGRW